MKNNLLLILLSIISTGCVNNPYKNYIGYWQNDEPRMVIEVKKQDNNEYIALMNERILEKKDVLNNEELKDFLNEPIVLDREISVLKKMPDGRLGIEHKSTIIPINLSDDIKSLVSNGVTFKKVDEEIAKEDAKNIYKCTKLFRKFHDETIDLRTYESEEDSVKWDEIKLKYKQMAEKIPHCRDFKD